MMANVNLSQRDIDYISRVVDTEVPRSLAKKNPTEYRRMVNAVVDTVTNRIASGQYPSTVTGVVNQPRQFSKITGPAALDPYGSIQATPKANPQTRALVDDYVASRAQGVQPEIGGALNYANPNFSSRSALTGWIDPMISAGATMLGVGNNVHWHGTAPGRTPASPYSLTAEGIPSGLLATPQSRPTDNLAGYRSTDVQRSTPTAFDNSRFSNSAPPVTSKSGLASALQAQAAAATPAFDSGRFGPAPVNIQTLASQQPQGSTFDPGRFGPQPVSQNPAFNNERFANAPVAQGVDALRQGLLSQQLNEGILPSLQYSMPLSPELQALGQPKTVTTQPLDTQVRQPGYQPTPVAQAQVQPPQVQSGLLSMPEYNQVMAAGGFTPATATPGLANRVEQGLARQKLAGGVLGGLLGGLTLGPLGAIAGGLLGRNVAQNNYYPEAPTPPNGVKRTSASGNGGFGGLSDYGRSVASSSGQFSSAVSSGKSGLW